MRNRAVPVRAAITVALSSVALFLVGCKQDEPPLPIPSADITGDATDAGDPLVGPSDDASGAASAAVTAALDMDALDERRDPERLLRFYTNAIRLGAWQVAAKAWTLDALMTPEKLQAEFGGKAGPKIAVGKGDTEGAAGTLYYEAPLVIDFADGRPSKRGTIVLSRVNDVPGASEQQLTWRIERTSTLAQ